MTPVNSRSLKLWIPLLVSGTLIALWSTMTWNEYQQLESDLIASRLDFVTYDMSSLQREMDREISKGEISDAGQALSARGVNSRYQIVLSTDERGKILHTTRLALKGQQVATVLQDFNPQRFTRLQQVNRSDVGLEPDQRRITAYFPLTLARSAEEIRPLRTGALFAVYDLSDDYTQIWQRLWRNSLLVGMLLLFVMAALIGFLQYFVTGPIQHLVSAAGAIAKDEPGARSNIVGHGELARLGNAFNNMSEKLDERARQRRKLEEERERLTLAIEHAAESFIITDAAGSIQYANPAFEKTTGYQRKEAIGRNMSILKSGKQDVVFYKNLWNALQRGDTWVGQFVNKKKNGMLFTVEAVISPVRDPAGRTINYVYVGRDITEELKREEQSRQGQKMESVGRLAGGVAHDFNNMLGVILGHTEMALQQVEPSHPLHDDLTEIRSAAERSAGLTRQLLAFARQQTIAPKILDLNQTVAGMLNMLRRIIGEDINLAWLPEKGLWPVKVDATQIDQILANLCVNARDAIEDVGKVTIETRNTTLDEAYCANHPGLIPGEYVLLAVNDDGCGMDKETVNNIYEPFFTTKEIGKGTGLGLATVYGIVKQNSGFIDLYSEPAYGTTFKIYLPRHSATVTVTATQKMKNVSAKPAKQKFETILLVEDDPVILRMVTRMLEDHGYTVLATPTPGEAIRLAETYPEEIHLLMTDVVMPEMNGRDLAKNLLICKPNLKLLFMSGYTANVIAHHGVLDEGVHFLEKPFAMKDLIATVREVLDNDGSVKDDGYKKTTNNVTQLESGKETPGGAA